MACLFYAFGGPDSAPRSPQFGFLDRANLMRHECEWDTSLDLCPDADGIVRVLADKVASNAENFYFPPEVAYLSSLEVLDFMRANVGHAFASLVPSDVPGNLGSLQTLRLVEAKLTGTIPSSLGLFTSLTYLDLSGNSLTGTIPSELGLLSNLETLVLFSNNLSGQVPREIASLSQLRTLELVGNPDMDTALPLEFCGVVTGTSLELLQTDWCVNKAECCRWT